MRSYTTKSDGTLVIRADMYRRRKGMVGAIIMGVVTLLSVVGVTQQPGVPLYLLTVMTGASTAILVVYASLGPRCVVRPETRSVHAGGMSYPFGEIGAVSLGSYIYHRSGNRNMAAQHVQLFEVHLITGDSVSALCEELPRRDAVRTARQDLSDADQEDAVYGDPVLTRLVDAHRAIPEKVYEGKRLSEATEVAVVLARALDLPVIDTLGPEPGRVRVVAPGEVSPSG